MFFWFFIDLIASFPFNFIVIFLLSTFNLFDYTLYEKNQMEVFYQIILFSRFFLMFQILKIFKVYKLSFELRSRLFNPTLFRLFNLIILSFLIAHWVGCGWFFIGNIEGFGINDWVPSLKLKNSTIFKKYLASLYWGFIHSTVIDNSTPYTILETIFSLLILFIGVSMYATIIGNVGSLLSNLDAASVIIKILIIINGLHIR